MIDWLNHDGVNLAMLNDHLRNQFYDRILSQHVKDRHCVDIGFGTGLLSMLALKHGARSVVAVESDEERYRLGLNIINQCDLQDRVRLYHTRYRHDMPLYIDDAVFFSETVNGNLWQEGLWSSLPRTSGHTWLPNTIAMNISTVPINHSFAAGLTTNQKVETRFDPGVDISEVFLATINDYLETEPRSGHLDCGVHYLSTDQLTPWGANPWMRMLNADPCIQNGYLINVEKSAISTHDATQDLTTEIDFDSSQIVLQIDTSISHTSPLLLIPRAAIGHGDDLLYLDRCHWGPMQSPVIVVGVDRIAVRHDLINGDLIYEAQ